MVDQNLSKKNFNKVLKKGHLHNNLKIYQAEEPLEQRTSLLKR